MLCRLDLLFRSYFKAFYVLLHLTKSCKNTKDYGYSLIVQKRVVKVGTKTYFVTWSLYSVITCISVKFWLKKNFGLCHTNVHLKLATGQTDESFVADMFLTIFNGVCLLKLRDCMFCSDL